jgi:hypothetical protein
MIEVTAKATRAIVEVDGVPCRVWVAQTRGGKHPGTEVTLYVRRVAVCEGEPEEVLEGLEAVPQPNWGDPVRRFGEAVRQMRAWLPDRGLINISVDPETGQTDVLANLPKEELPIALRALADALEAEINDRV